MDFSPQAGSLVVMLRYLFAVCLLASLLGGSPMAAEVGEIAAYDAAVKSFRDGFFQRSEKEFAEFAQKFPKSEKNAEALLLQAQSRHQLKRFDAGLELLKGSMEKAGPLADQFVFWMAECEFERGGFAAAEGLYARLLKDFPQSSLRLNASYGRALAQYRKRDLAGAVASLSAPAGEFQKASQTSPNETLVVRGHLLLAESLLSQGQTGPAKEVLKRLSDRTLKPELEWEKADLQARVELAGPAPENALPLVANAVAAARSAGNFGLQAQAFSLEAEIQKKLNQPARAIQAYEKINTAEGMPADQRRLAVLKQIELMTGQNQLSNAVERLELFLAQAPTDPAADLLHIKTGELLIQQFRSAADRAGWPNPAPQAATATNHLVRARGHFDFVINQLTNSPHVGKAYLDRGWSFWEEGTASGQAPKIAESLAAFRIAAEKLPFGEDQASAAFKAADALFQQQIFTAAVTNYQTVITAYAELPQVRSNLFDQAFHQIVRAQLELGSLDSARETLGRMDKMFPNSPHTEQAHLLLGQALADKAKTGAAREVFAGFVKQFPKSSLIPEARLASARILGVEQNWTAALAEYDQWVASYANHPGRAQAEFDRAWIYDQAGQETNAYRLFTNFLTRFPTHSLAPVAQNWVADYYRGQENWTVAEQNYQRLFQNTNWPVTELTYQARLMASKTAYFRQGYDDAQGYLTNLISDPACPPGIKAEAWFVFGDVLVERRSDTLAYPLTNFVSALNAFNRITSQYPTNRLAPLAWGKKGDCHFQLATAYPKSYEDAEEAYKTVLNWTATEAPISARNQAEFGLAMVWEKRAFQDGRSVKDRAEWLSQALDRLLNIIYSKNLAGKQSDPFWVKKAGLAAGRISEALGQKEAAVELYRRLIKELPSMRPLWESKIQALQAPPPA